MVSSMSRLDPPSSVFQHGSMMLFQICRQSWKNMLFVLIFILFAEHFQIGRGLSK